MSVCVCVCVCLRRLGWGRNAKLTLKKQFPCNPSAAWRQSRRYFANYKINGHEFPQLSHPEDHWSRSSPRLCSNEPKLPPRPPRATPLNPSLPLSLTRLPYTFNSLSFHHLPSYLSPTFPWSVCHQETKALGSAFFIFFSQAGEKTPNRHWLAGDRPSLMKSKLSIRAQHLHTGTNEARRSPTLIPLHLTHFIDSPCFSNEMLNISPSAVARWQLLLWRWREWERNVTVTHTHVHMYLHTN